METSYYLNSQRDVLWHTITCSVSAGILFFLWFVISAYSFGLDSRNISFPSIWSSLNYRNRYFFTRIAIFGDTVGTLPASSVAAAVCGSRASANVDRFQVFRRRGDRFPCSGFSIDPRNHFRRSRYPHPPRKCLQCRQMF